ncbi:MAG: dTDP-4-dehydrorhamnose reductase [Candidatus Cryptobacteroides sp.]
MTILVTGANGQLGNWMRRMADDSDFSFVFTDIAVSEGVGHLDITDSVAVRRMVQEHGIGAIVNCAAYNNVEGAESDIKGAWKLNVEAPGILAGVMKEAGGLLVHFSSDYVFGGEDWNVPYGEDHAGSPLGVYGRSKLEGERKVAESGCSNVIFRTAWLYSEYGKNFCKTILSLTASKPQLKVVFDQVGTPTYARDLAGAVMTILNDYSVWMNGPGRESRYEKSGLYNFSDEGVCSWYDFARMISELSGHDNCAIIPCHSHEFPSRVTRPSYSVLDKTRIKETFGIRIPHWTDSLKACISNMKQNGELRG